MKLVIESQEADVCSLDELERVISIPPVVSHALAHFGLKLEFVRKPADTFASYFYFLDPLKSDVKQALECEGLIYWSSESTPHNRAEEGFRSTEGRTVLIFPK